VSLPREEIIRMAREAEAVPIRGEPKQLAIVGILMIERFANAAYAAGAAAEREKCAEVCDGWSHADGDLCAAAIRARGNGGEK